MRSYKYSYDYEALSKAIKQAREGRGLTQAALGKAVSRSVPTISKLEAGKQYPTIGVLACICWLLDVNLNDFLFINGDLSKTLQMWDEKIVKKGLPLSDREYGNVEIEHAAV